MNKVRQYIEESYDEILNKVTWPTYAELQSSSVLVLIASLIFALVVFFIDVVFDRASSLLYQSF
jgi:preprotein translocase subunit SecE